MAKENQEDEEFGDANVSDLQKLPKRKVKELGGEAYTKNVKSKTGGSKSDLYWNPDTGDVYSVRKGSQYGSLVDWVDPNE